MRTPLGKYVADVIRGDHLIAEGTAIVIDFDHRDRAIRLRLSAKTKETNAARAVMCLFGRIKGRIVES
jgi:hypothetical protein